MGLIETTDDAVEEKEQKKEEEVSGGVATAAAAPPQQKKEEDGSGGVAAAVVPPQQVTAVAAQPEPQPPVKDEESGLNSRCWGLKLFEDAASKYMEVIFTGKGKNTGFAVTSCKLNGPKDQCDDIIAAFHATKTIVPLLLHEDGTITLDPSEDYGPKNGEDKKEK